MMKNNAILVGIVLGLINSVGWINYHLSKYGHLSGWLLLMDVFLTLAACSFGFLAGRAHDKVRYLAEIDPLTNAYNRRITELKFNKAATNHSGKQEIMVYLVDCDHFKKINDNFGHKMGDQVLRSVSHLLKNSVSQKDIVSRWGGDEFLIILFHAKNPTAWSDAVQSELQHLSKDYSFPIELSFGHALFPTEAKTLDELVRLADDRMYENKKNKYHGRLI